MGRECTLSADTVADTTPNADIVLEADRLLGAAGDADVPVRLVVGDGGHDGNHGGVLLPDALRWLWRLEPSPA